MTVKQISTSFINGEKTSVERDLSVSRDDDRQELRVINLYPQMQYQTWEHFGGAVTDAAASVLSALPPERAGEIIRAYFGKDGIGYGAIRAHMDSCDFSSAPYAALSDPADTDFRSFSLRRDESGIIPWIRAAYAEAGRALPVMLTPWTPPAFMKTNQSRIGGGHLKEEYYPFWAKYICKYVGEYRERGINVTALSVQNEPNAVQTWDSCIYSVEEERRFIAEALYPEMLRQGLGDLGIYIWDHNKERAFDRACAAIGPETDAMIAGLAFHWYSGDHFDALRLIRERFPEKKLIFTEGCIEYSIYDQNQLTNAQKYAHDMIGNLNAGMNAFYDWNICLDEHGGPNWVKNYCEAPVMCSLESGGLEYKLSFDYIAHFSRYICPGAKRIAHTVFTDALDCTAFLNPDESITVAALNREETPQNVFFRLSGQVIAAELPANSLSTLLIRQ